MRVVCVRGVPPGAPGVVYLGRACRGWPAHPLANPFPLAREADRGSVLARYRAWLDEKVAADDRAVVAALAALPPDAALGCWCVDRDEPAADGQERCHCEIVIKAWRRLILGE